MERQKTIIDKQLGGLSLMILLTLIWTILSEINYQGNDYYAFAIAFGVIIVYFVFTYFTLSSLARSIPRIIKEDRKREKWYWIIFILEGLFIFITKNILDNIHYSQLFISCFALIVGLHFFPLAKVFDRKFDYYIGSWTTLIALAGIVTTLQNIARQNLIDGVVCSACALSTTIYGFKMIHNANRLALIQKNEANSPFSNDITA